MDQRIPLWLRKTLTKLDWFALPNLGMLVAGLGVLGFVGQNMLGLPMDRFYFIPQLVLQGEWWRIFAYPTVNSPLWLFFFALYTYFIMNSLENQWGSAPLTVFTFSSYLAAVGGAFITMRPVDVWYHVIENISLAFGTVFPNFELLLFLVLPVKAKYLAMLAGALILFQFVTGGMATKLFILISVSPYLIFFGPVLYSEVQDWRKHQKHKKRYDKDMWR